MIYTTVNVTVDERSCTCDKKIVLYRGDKNVELRFVIKGNKFIVLKNMYAQMVIKRPSASSIFSEPKLIQNDTVVFVVSETMIDELNELGAYTFQIRLFDDNMVAQATLPPCKSFLIIESPLVTDEGGSVGVVGLSGVNRSMVMAADALPEDIYDYDGNYNKTEWYDGDIISDIRLNKIEEALYSINAKNLEQDDVIANLGPGGGAGMTDEEREQLNKNTSDIETIIGIIDTPPTYSIPTLSIGLSKTTLEHGVQASVIITPNFSQNDAGEVTNYSLSRNGIEIFNDFEASPFIDDVTLNHNQTASYSATVYYEDGPIKDTLMGVPYPDGSIKAGSKNASGSAKAYALSYHGVISGSTINENDISSLISRLGTSKSYTYTTNLDEQRIVYMYPASFGGLTSIKDANNFDYINSYTSSMMSYNGVEYRVYILTDPVTITNFKQIFN